MPVIPVFLLIGRSALGEVHVITVSVDFPLRVVGLLSGPHVMVVVVGVVNADVGLASAAEQGQRDGRRQQEGGEAPQQLAHSRLLFSLAKSQFSIARTSIIDALRGARGCSLSR